MVICGLLSVTTKGKSYIFAYACKWIKYLWKDPKEHDFDCFWGRKIKMLGPEVGGELFAVHFFVPLTIWMISIIHPKIFEFKIKSKRKSFNKEKKINLFYSILFKFYTYEFPSNTGYEHCPWSKQRPREQVTSPRPLDGFAKVLVTSYNFLYNWDDAR